MTSPILLISALGVRGGVRRRRESVVVWDLRSVVAAEMAGRGPVGRSWGPEREVEVVVGVVVSEEEKWESRDWVVCRREMSFGRSFGGGAMVGGLVHGARGWLGEN